MSIDARSLSLTARTMYQSTQMGTLVALILFLTIVMTAMIGYSSGWHPAILVFGMVMIAVLVIFRSLTIEIDSSELRCYFGDGLIRRRIPLTDIADAVAVRNKWYYGWGVRLIPSGWMFNVSGLDAVELTFVSGKRFRIGTDRPQEVIEALKQFKSSA